jgi:CRISPR-associated exonuclease Cas4
MRQLNPALIHESDPLQKSERLFSVDALWWYQQRGIPTETSLRLNLINGSRAPSQGSDVEQSPAVNRLFSSIGFVVVYCCTIPLTNKLSGMLWLAFVLLSIAAVMFWLSARQRRLAGLPGGRVIYVDTSQWAKVEKPLYDRALNLTGKPDYLVQSGDVYLPVEIKSSQVHQHPYDSHIYQLAAYCLLVERTYGYRPTYGILHYTNQTFAVDFTPQLERALLVFGRDLLFPGKSRRKSLPQRSPTLQELRLPIGAIRP